MVICIVLLKCPDITSCFLNAFKYSYEKKELLERKEFYQIFRTFNMLLENFGKKFKNRIHVVSIILFSFQSH